MLRSVTSWIPSPSAAELASAAAEVEGLSPLDILRWAAARFGPRVVFATGFGVEGCVIIDLIARARLPIDLITLDTGLFFPETYQLWRRLEQRYGVRIHAVRPCQTVAEQAAVHGDRLWERDPERCCALRKVEPLREALAGRAAWISAIRRDQTAERAATPVVERDARFGLVKINPLVSLSSRDVWNHVFAHDVPYNPLHDRGYASIGCAPCTTPIHLGEDPRAGRWRGRAQKECGLHAPGPPAAVPDRRNMGTLFPAFLKLHGRKVLLVGGGTVARDKLVALRAAGADVTVVAPEVRREIEEAGVGVARRPFEASDLDDAWLVVAAAPPVVNREVAAEAERRRIFVVAVDDRKSATAYGAGVIRRDGVTLAISTDGEAPGLTALLREALGELLPQDLLAWVETARREREVWRGKGTPPAARRPLLLEALNRLYAPRAVAAEEQAR